MACRGLNNGIKFGTLESEWKLCRNDDNRFVKGKSETGRKEKDQDGCNENKEIEGDGRSEEESAKANVADEKRRKKAALCKILRIIVI